MSQEIGNEWRLLEHDADGNLPPPKDTLSLFAHVLGLLKAEKLKNLPVLGQEPADVSRWTQRINNENIGLLKRYLDFAESERARAAGYPEPDIDIDDGT